MSGKHYKLYSYTPQIARLKYGVLLKEILEQFSMKLSGHMTPNRTVAIYSAHDSTLSNLLNMLGVFEVNCFLFNFGKITK